MLSREIAAEVWRCYRELEAAEKLLVDIAEIENRNKERFHGNGRFEKGLKDVFGREQELQLGVPSGENGHRLFGVSIELGKSVIRAHIANTNKTMAEVQERAKIELGMEKGGA